MNKFARAVCLGLLLAYPLAMAGCASTPTQESTGEFVDDAVITAKVKAALGSDKLLNVFQISVETYKGIVQLSGFVNTREQSAEAATIAAAVKGVREVRNNLILKAN